MKLDFDNSVFDFFIRNRLTAFAVALLALFLIAAFFGHWLSPYDAMETNASNSLKAPSSEHWFGTDQLGRDVLSRVIAGARMDFGIAFGSVVIASIVGTLTGLVAGFFGGWKDTMISRMTDTVMAFPLFVLAMAIVAALGNTVGNVILASSIINLPFYIRLARAESQSLRGAGYVEAARLNGNSESSVMLRHVLPNIMPAIAVQCSLNMGWAILNASALSFIGIGIRPPTAEWGIMVADGANFMITGEWWLSIFPGFALMLSVLCFNLLGDGMRDLIDVRKRTQ